MPISTADLEIASKTALDQYLRNRPVDQIQVELPFFKKLMSRRKLFLGARQNIVKQIRKDYGTNFAWAYGEDAVSFNRRDTIEQAAFPWRRAVDGFYIAYDTLFSNGIKVREGKRGDYKLETNEKVQLTNLLVEQLEAFKLGFDQKLSLELHRDGSASEDAVTGLDALISLTPETGTIGGINRASATYWRNYAETGITATTEGNLANRMEAAWRSCIRYGGGSPDFILAGSDFIDAYRQYAVTVTNNADAGKVKTIDAGVGSGVNTGLYFKGVEIIWDPQFEDLDSLETPTTLWAKRCYFINTRHLELHDDEMDIVTPVRPHDILAMYQMINLRLALVSQKSNAHAVLAIA